MSTEKQEESGKRTSIFKKPLVMIVVIAFLAIFVFVVISMLGSVSKIGGWTKIKIAEKDQEIKSILIDPVETSNIYVVAACDIGNDLYKSTDNGNYWKKVIINQGCEFNTIEMDLAAPSILFALTKDNKIYRSEDGGESWNPINNGKPLVAVNEGGVTHLAIDPTSLATIYAGTWSSGIIKSKDGGNSWVPSSYGLPKNGTDTRFVEIQKIIINPQNPSELFTSVVDPFSSDNSNPVFFTSTDGGASWADKGNKLPSGIRAMGSLTISQKAPYNLYFAGTSKISVSSDRGENWTELDTGYTFNFGGIQVIAIDPIDQNTIYIGTAANGIFKSIDGGRTWKEDNKNLMKVPEDFKDLLGTYYAINSIAINPKKPTTIFAGGLAGLYRME